VTGTQITRFRRQTLDQADDRVAVQIGGSLVSGSPEGNDPARRQSGLTALHGPGFKAAAAKAARS
jgi:hypothetical protein